ncbi:MAG: YgiQ family radical SAM protein [Spirochaetia bacterium]|jgi:uncharacterized radical SAM protein YgiQ|nr:YgiQ family radical SAM protein [Spirochaetia bacterium]
MFIPSTTDEFKARGWDRADVILVTGDAYIDSPSVGISIIGHVLMNAGFRVGVISQPAGSADISRLGEPRLFWGITSGAVDSMVSNYNADRSRRRHDDLTPGGANNARPDRACIAYTGLIRSCFKKTVPIVLGGIEASLRRIAHYDYWQNTIRRSILFDAKADIIIYGMGELAVLSLAQKISGGADYRTLPGICFIANEAPAGALELPSFEEALSDVDAFAKMFLMAGSGPEQVLVQKHGARFLVQNPPSRILTPAELDRVYELPYERELHPYCAAMGSVRALETIRFSLTTHRGCFGGCNFCSISMHQGGSVVSRTEDSLIREAVSLSRHALFAGVISDAGGASANMYGTSCAAHVGACRNKSCLMPAVCPSLRVDHGRLTMLLAKLRELPGIKHLFVASGIRYDLILADEKNGEAYLRELVEHHISGLMRIAPEHSSPHVLELMGKPSSDKLIAFRNMFEKIIKKTGKKTGLSYYLMAAHPGCSLEDMSDLQKVAGVKKGPIPASVQIFTPTPSTLSTLMYYTGKDARSGDPVFVERDMGKKQKQKRSVMTFDLRKR